MMRASWRGREMDFNSGLQLSFSIRPCILSIGLATVHAILGASFMASAMSSRADGAPIAFAFNGTVREIDKSQNATFDLPFAAAVGDLLSGLLTLGPVGFG